MNSRQINFIGINKYRCSVFFVYLEFVQLSVSHVQRNPHDRSNPNQPFAFINYVIVKGFDGYAIIRASRFSVAIFHIGERPPTT